MRGNTNPCTQCEFCDDSCDVCLHLPYELADPAFYREASSDDEAEAAAASSDADCDSDEDEDGSWFTTDWSKLISQRVAGYEVDPEVGVQLTPLQPDQAVAEDAEGGERDEEEDTRWKKWAPKGQDEQEESRNGRRTRRLRRRRTRASTPVELRIPEAEAEPQFTAAIVEVDALQAAPASEGEGEERTQDAAAAPATGSDAQKRLEPAPAASTAAPANDVAAAEFIPSGSALANDAARNDGASVPKDAHDNTWRKAVQASAPLVSVS